MLNAKTIEIIKSTVPVLEVHGNAITTRFYERLFTNHPELLNIFNQTNQKQGRQQAALANAVIAAAANIDNLAAIIPVVKQIGQKHRSLGILAEHYPIVGTNLLAAIKDVLGDAATDEIMDAWTLAYGVIADAFIGIERDMYTAAENQTGGWAGFRNFVVANKIQESDVITSFYLRPQDGQPIASFLPGQYLTLKVQIPGETYTHMRQYSLSDAPEKDYYRISVKREAGNDQTPAGVVSNYLHNTVQEGDVLTVSAPAGDFVLDMEASSPVVLLSGGVGLTPMMSMLNTLVEKQPERNVTFIHAAINSNFHAFGEHVKQTAERHDNVTSYVVYEKPTDADRAANNFDKEGYINLEWLKSVLPSNEAVFYFCGPLPFMKALNGALREWGVPAENIRFEFFGPATALE